jgi:uncharacterized protein
MILRSPATSLRAGLLAFAVVAFSIPAAAPQQPSANAIRLAREIITVKGTAKTYEQVIVEVVDRSKGVLVQTNPMLSRDLNEVATKIRNASAPRVGELLNEVAKMYAARFTEQELKDVLAFYKSAAGQKVIIQEPAIFEESIGLSETWADKFSSEVLVQIRAEMKKRGHNL